jgi:hypothetical protein
MFMLVLLAGVAAVSDDRRHVIVGLALALPTLVLNFLRSFLAGSLADVAAGALFIVFFVYVVAILLTHVARAKRADAETLYGAAAVYLLLGLLWALGFEIGETLRPGSLTLGLGGEAIGGPGNFRTLIYYSFVTITTLGYGDVTPTSELARLLALLEAVLGQLFLVVVVARLVGLYTAEQFSRLGKTSMSS